MTQQTITTRKFRDYTHLFDADPDLVHFRKTLLLHYVFEKCEETILEKIANPASFNIVSVVGPSGAGKTQLLNEIAGTLLQVGAPALPKEGGENEKKLPYLPVIYVLAKSGRTFESRFRSVLIDILREVNGVLVEIGKTVRSSDEQKVIKTKSQTSILEKETVSLERLSIPSLQGVVRSALKERCVRAVLIDEAQHLAPLASQKHGFSSDYRLIADGLKVLVSNIPTLIVLFGTAELLSLPNLSAQLGRRSTLIHFRRYQWNDDKDRQEFRWVVEQFIKTWPKHLPKSLLDDLAFLYAGCLGCVGILSDWLAVAMSRVTKPGVHKVTPTILDETALGKPRLLRIKSEAEECEIAFEQEAIGPRQMIAELCAGRSSQSSNGGNASGGDSDEAGDDGLKAKRKKGNLLPGKRKQTKGYDNYKPRHKVA